MFLEKNLPAPRDEKYAKIASGYQYRILKCWSAILASNEIKKCRCEHIMREFAFDFGMLHDQGGTSLSGNKEMPNRSLEPVITFREGKEICIGSEYFQLYECAFANVERAVKIRFGHLVNLFHKIKRLR